jgi:hypothetical protein
MKKIKILLCIILSLFLLSACYVRRDQLHNARIYFIVKASKNKTLRKLNDSATTKHNIYILAARHMDRLNFGLLKPEVRNKVQEIIYVSNSTTKAASQLAYFPNLRHIEILIENKNSFFAVDSSFRRFRNLQQLYIFTDSISISFLPDSLNFLCAGGKGIYFPFIPHRIPFWSFQLTAENYIVDYRNLENIKQHATVRLGLYKGINVDSIYCHLRADTLQELGIFSNAPCKCNHACKIPYVKHLYVNDYMLCDESCKKYFNADSVMITISKENDKSYTEGQYNDRFLQKPVRLETWKPYEKVRIRKRW